MKTYTSWSIQSNFSLSKSHVCPLLQEAFARRLRRYAATDGHLAGKHDLRITSRSLRGFDATQSKNFTASVHAFSRLFTCRVLFSPLEKLKMEKQSETNATLKSNLSKCFTKNYNTFFQNNYPLKSGMLCIEIFSLVEHLLYFCCSTLQHSMKCPSKILTLSKKNKKATTAQRSFQKVTQNFKSQFD